MALGYDGSVRIKADLNHSNFDRGLESMTGQVNKFGSTLKKLVGVIGLAFGTAALVNFGKESIKLASDIQEVQNVIDVTFGQGAEQIEEFAKSAAEAFGLSELSAKQYTGTMGAMLKSSGLATKEAQEMSVALAGLTGDLASFYNLETDMAFEKIRSGISGETEPLKQLGINMSVANLEAYALTKGITKSYNAMSQAEQVMLRYNYLLSVTGDAQGDFARTSDSLANQTRILSLNFNQLKIALGNALIPIAQAVLPGINAIIASLTKLATVFSKVTALLFGKSTQVKETTGVSVSAGAAAESTDKLADSLGAAGDAAKKAGKDMKSVSAPFDEFNIIADNAAGSADDLASGLGGIDGFGGESGGEIWSDAKINPALTEDVYALIKKLEEMIPLIAGIGAGFLSWKLAKSLVPDLGLLQGILGSLMVTAGITLLVDSIKDIIFGNGLTWDNILKGAAGGALAGGGLGFMLAKKLGLTWAHGMLSGAVIGLGIALLIESVADIIVRGLNIGNGILGAIGGAIAGAASGALVIGGPAGAILGATIGVGVSLIIESITDIVAHGQTWGNSILGLIGGALAGAAVGLIPGMGGPLLGAVIGVGITLLLEGITSQIKSGVNLWGALQTILGTALAGAGIGFAVGGGIGAAAGFVIGLTAGILIEITGIKLAGEAAYAATEDFQTMKRIIDECEGSANRSSTAMENLKRNVQNLTSSLADVGAAQQLVDEIYAINENANASNYELELMKTKVELLNSMGLDGLHLTIDETTGRIIETKEATDQLILSLQKEAETAALQELLVQAYKDRYQAVIDAEKATKNIDIAEQALAETERQLANTPWWDLKKHAELTAQLKKQKEALETGNDARNSAITAYNELGGAINTYSGALTDLSEPESSVGVQLESRMDSVRQKVEGVANDMPGYGQRIGEGVEKGIYDGINQNIPSVSELISGFLTDTENSISTSWDNVSTDTSEKWDGIKTGLSGKYSEIDTETEKGFTNVHDTAIKKIDETMSDLEKKDWKSVGSKMSAGILGGLNGIFSGLGKWAADVASQISKVNRSGGNTVSNSRSSSRSYSLPETYSIQNLPMLANGAVIPPNRQFAAILGDQRSGVNIEAPLATIKQAVTEAMQSAGGFGGDINITVESVLDGKVIARNTINHVNSMTRSAGRSPLLGMG